MCVSVCVCVCVDIIGVYRERWRRGEPGVSCGVDGHGAL